jgi:hypothetical protein
MIMQGCVPAIIQDHVYQPFEDLLPYDDFTLRLPKQDLRRWVGTGTAWLACISVHRHCGFDQAVR